MIRLAKEIVTIIVDEYGQEEFLQRISDPLWFQALGCVLGYDWHSSGVTTVLTGVLKSAVNPNEQGVAVCGGKGGVSRQAPMEISNVGETFGFTAERINRLRYASKMSAKVDNTAIQAGYPLYHHAFFITEDGKWAVVQQGMSVKDRTARRYHWIQGGFEGDNFVEEPHSAIVGDVRREFALDMTSRDSEACRKVSTDVVKEGPRKMMKMLGSIRPIYQKSLEEWIPGASWKNYPVDVLSLPRDINWKAVKMAYEFQPRDYEELLSMRGIGPATVRALALISELIYGEKPSWKDPVKYSFCVGGKDCVPYPVDRDVMDESTQILKTAIKNARMGNKERLMSLQRLRRYVPSGYDIE